MTSIDHPPSPDIRASGAAIEVLLIFLRLGVSCFGGPIAHIGYFRDEFVTRRRWLDEQSYADLVALCQFLPGPASSQVGFSIGLMRAGFLGGLAAWPASHCRPPQCWCFLPTAPARLAVHWAPDCSTVSSSSPLPLSRRRYGAWRGHCARIARERRLRLSRP